MTAPLIQLIMNELNTNFTIWYYAFNITGNINVLVEMGKTSDSILNDLHVPHNMAYPGNTNLSFTKCFGMNIIHTVFARVSAHGPLIGPCVKVGGGL